MTLPVPLPSQFVPQRSALHLIVWDAPNVDMTLTGVIGRRPTASTRPRYNHVATWFLADADVVDEVQAVVFTNYVEGTASNIRPWLEAVRGIGFDVFIKPKLGPDDDIDADMLEHIRASAKLHRLVRLAVVSGDGKNFQEPLEALADAGVDVTVVSFNEVASWARVSPSLKFMDLEDIPGAFQLPLNRISLEHLPPEGAWLPATGDLRANAPELADAN